MGAEDPCTAALRADAVVGHSPLRQSGRLIPGAPALCGFKRALQTFHPPDEGGDSVLCNGLKDARLAAKRFTVNRAHCPEVQFPYPSHTNES